jgi:hypothetical protein
MVAAAVDVAAVRVGLGSASVRRPDLVGLVPPGALHLTSVRRIAAIHDDGGVNSGAINDGRGINGDFIAVAVSNADVEDIAVHSVVPAAAAVTIARSGADYEDAVVTDAADKVFAGREGDPVVSDLHERGEVASSMAESCEKEESGWREKRKVTARD